MCLKYSSPAVSLSFALNFIFLLYAFVKGRLKIKDFPLKKPYCILSLMFIMGIIASSLPLIKTGPYVFDMMVSYMIVPLFFYEVRTANDYMLSLKCFLIAMFGLCSYSIVEFVLQSNPFIDNAMLSIPEEWGGRLYAGNSRYGSIRTQSIMNICIGWGGLCSMIVGVLLYCKDTIQKLYRPFLYWIFLLVAIFCTLTTGTRSAYVFLVIVLMGGFYVSGSNKFAMIILGIVGFYIIGDQMSEIANSVFSSNKYEDGSSADMRQLQFAAAIEAISHSPVWGFGIKGATMASQMYDGILGSESIWLKRLLDFGLTGVIIQIYLYYKYNMFLFHKSSKHYRFLSIAFVVGWVSFCTLTSSPGLGEPYFLIVLVLLAKSNLIKYAK